MISILIADDHAIVRKGLIQELKDDNTIEVINESADGPDAMAKIAALRPDILILDISLPGANGLQVLDSCAKLSPSTKCVAFSMYNSEDLVIECLRRGALAFVSKLSPLTDITRAIHAAQSGDKFVSEKALGPRVADFLNDSDKVPPLITPRQMEVLKLLAAGESTQQIAHILGISPKTVETHRAQMMQRLGAHNLADLVRLAIERGLA